MRAINRFAVLETIRRESPISRTVIAARLGVSLPTVMRIVEELEAEGMVRAQGSTEWSGGRRRPLLEFNAEGNAVIGVDLSGPRMFGAIADLGGSVLHEAEVDRSGGSGEENYQCLTELIQFLLVSPHLAGRRLRGVSVGAPGVTLHGPGIVVWAPSLDWRDYPLKARLTQQFGHPVIVDNDANLAALGELWFGAGQHAQNMVQIAIGAGIGVGIIIAGGLYRGAHEASGEIGYLLPGREFLGRHYVGYGALESLTSCTAILERGRRALSSLPGGHDQAALSLERVFRAARDGEPWATRIVEETVDYLAISVGSIAAYFDPEVIVLGGSLADFAGSLLGPILKRMEGAVPAPPKVVASALGHRAVVLGAISNVLHNTADFYVVQKLS
jgi:predicted NBD/HSP70 family sugar kinase